MAQADEIPAGRSAADLLERESRDGGRAGVAAIGAGLALLASVVVQQVLLSGRPAVYLTDALRDAAGESLLATERPGLLTEQLQYMHDHFALSVVGALVQVAHLAGLAFALSFLFAAVRGRLPQRMQTWARPLVLTGAVVLALATLVQLVGLQVSIGDFLDGSNQTTQGARDALEPQSREAALIFNSFGAISLSIGWILIALNAMRAGLLTRFMGVLGILCGASTFLASMGILGSLAIIQIFWLSALGLLFLRRAPQGMPPAWISGKAEPWPSAQELREQREAAAPAADAEPEGEEKGPSPATSARKRKRRGG